MRRILVVDDDPHVGQAVRGWLRYHGLRVQLAGNSVGGLTVLDPFGFDLLIADVVTPDLCCFESIRLFHARAPTVPLIAISGSALPNPSETAAADLLKLAARLGATRCLRKPFKPATLLDVIDECLSRAEPHHRYAAALGAVANAPSEPQSEVRMGN